MPQNRRSFLKAAGIATAIASAAPLALSLQGETPGQPGTVSAADKRGYVAGKYALELDGASMGDLTGWEGGMPYGEVFEVREGGGGGGAGGLTKKGIGNVKYEEVSLRVGLGMGGPFWSWISAMLSGKPVAKSGAIVPVGNSPIAGYRLDFREALITSVTFPKMDGASKEAAYLDVTVSPESTTFSSTTTGPSPATVKQKQWHSANFRIKIGDLPAKRVSKVDAFTIKQRIVESSSGEQRDPIRVPGRLEFPNLVVTVPQADGAEWLRHFDSFVVQGKNSDEFELAGMLEYLAPDLKSVLASVSFAGLGIFALAPEKVEAGGEQIRSLQASFYSEQVMFTGPQVATAE